MEVVGNRNSSVLTAIRSQVIWGQYIKKLECSCKSCVAKMEAIVCDNSRFKGNGGLMQKVICRPTAAARAAIRMHSPTRNIHQLRLDPAVRPPVRAQYNHCRSRKSIRGHIPMHDLLPVYIPFLLQVISLLYFTSTTPTKDQTVEQLFLCPLVLVS